jgi:hypothetical protein
MTPIGAIGELTTEAELEAASNDLERRRLAAHVAFKAEGAAITSRRNQIRAVATVAGYSPEERAALAEVFGLAKTVQNGD